MVARSDSRSVQFRADVEKAKPGMSPGDRVLLDEACRLLDRLDRFDALIAGDVKAWAVIEWPFEDAPAALVISPVVAEARQTVSELRQVVKALAIPAEQAKADGPSKLEVLLGGKSKGA